MNTNGEVAAELRYTAFGETWYENGQTPTELQYTGQREFGELGLYFYQSRFYDAMLGRFVQADTIIPENEYPLAWDRFSYSYNNPIRFTDPTGHKICWQYCPGENFQPHVRRTSSPATPSLPPPTPVPTSTPNVSTTPTPSPTSQFFYRTSPQSIGSGAHDDLADELLKELIKYWKMAQEIKTLDEALEFVNNYGRPIYKHVRGLGSIVSPPVEGGIGFSLQLLSDLKSNSLSPAQIFGRATVVGVEDFAIDVFSGVVGAATGTIVGGVFGASTIEVGGVGGLLGLVGFAAGSYATTHTFDAITPSINHDVFP